MTDAKLAEYRAKLLALREELETSLRKEAATTEPVKPRDDGHRKPRPATKRAAPTNPPAWNKECATRHSRARKSRNPSTSSSPRRNKKECKAKALELV